jgi:SNF2 family DNA or RNA helicase
MEELSCLNERIEEVKGLLRPYQREVFERMVQDKRHLCYLEMGMGKSLVTLLAVMELKAFPCMIVCNKSAMGVLEAELKKWFDEEAIIYAGTPKQREKAWINFVVQGKKFIITNYALCEELGIRFGLVQAISKRGSSMSGTAKAQLPHNPGTHQWVVGSLVADEIQVGGLFNHKTKTYKVFKQLARKIPVVYLLTGTPYRRGAIDFFAPLSLVDPKTFDSYWKYVSKYCLTVTTPFGKSIERNPKNVPQFRAMLRKYASILRKADYLKDLPQKIRQPVPILMDKEQEKIYKELVDEMLAVTATGELIITPSILSLMVRLRQLLVCPQELGLKTRGAAIDTLLEMTEDLVGEAKPFVVFTPFRKAVPWIEQALVEKYPDIKVYKITGGLTPEQFTEQWKGFQEYTGRSPRALICVIKSGASFHATAADTAFFLGYEYDFNQNVQAEDRLYRIGQTKTVTCYYMMHKNTIEEDIIQILNDKKYASDLVLSDEEVFKKMIRGRAIEGRRL